MEHGYHDCCVAGEPHEPMAPSVHDIHSNGCTVTYQSPVFEGRSPVTGYVLNYKTSDRPWTSVTKHLITDTSVRLRELHPGTEYTFHVAAVNFYGVGQFSPASVPVVTSRNKPVTQPSCPVISSDGRSVDLDWTSQPVSFLMGLLVYLTFYLQILVRGV